MSSANPKFNITVTASVSLAGAQYCGVTSSGALPAAGGKIAGILQNNPLAGQQGSVATAHLSKALAGGTIAKDDDLTVDATGKLVKAAAGDRICASAMEAAVEGDIFQVMLTNAGAAVAAP